MIVCPAGWKLPDRGEWNTLISALGTIPGKNLKAKSSEWGDAYGTNASGFTALPGGARTDGYTQLGMSGHWWTATQTSNTENYSYTKTIGSGNGVGESTGSGAANGVNGAVENQLSVRCIKGEKTASLIQEGAPLVDTRDNNKTYRTVVIGTQRWMAENLNYETENSKCYLDGASNCAIYGRLYTWADAMDTVASYIPPAGTVRQGICPNGWHLPSKAEWDDLLRIVGANPGKKLKAKSSEWDNAYGTDAYGFAALPSGALINTGFTQLGMSSHWWTSTGTSNTGNYSYTKTIGSGNGVGESTGSGAANGVTGLRTNLISVRCVENAQ
jgi:uncharacterized protein (TIGR02145 family)